MEDNIIKVWRSTKDIGFNYSIIPIPENIKGRFEKGNDLKNSSQTSSNSGNIYELNGLERINIFIGSNNSGKSRFLRKLFISDPYVVFRKHVENEINDFIMVFNNNVSNNSSKIIIENYKDLNERQIFPHLKKYLIPHPITIPLGYNKRDIEDKTYGGLYEKLLKIMDSDDSVFARDTRILINKYFNELKDSVTAYLNLTFRSVYIPSIRGLRGYEKIYIDDSLLYDTRPTSIIEYNKIKFTDLYKGRTLSDYFIKYTNRRKDIFTGLEMYKDVKKMLLGGSQDRDTIRNFEEFLSNCFFDNKKITIIPFENVSEDKLYNDNDVLYIKIDNDEQFPIYDLGDGIQQLIIITFCVFANPDKYLYLFVEEPELYLHPALQRKFIEVFLSHEAFKKTQLFFTTHSNHFLDLTFDYNNISVFKFSRKKDAEQVPTEKPAKSVIPHFEIENVNNNDMRILNELGVRDSSVFHVNAMIWVEGIYDVKYIRKYFEIYQSKQLKQYKEDIHYGFITYGGANIAHWSFIDDKNRLKYKNFCSKIFVIADSDGTNCESTDKEKQSKKSDRLTKIEKNLGKERFCCLPRREIENLITPNILRQVIKNDLKADINDISKPDYSAYENEYLGRYIDNNITYKGQPINKKNGETVSKYALNVEPNKSGTIKDKNTFSESVINLVKDINDLSKDAKELCEKIYTFVKNHNE